MGPKARQMRLPEPLAPKARKLVYRRARGLEETDSIHKGCTQNLTCSESKCRGSNLEEAGSDLGEPPRKAGGNETLPRDRDASSHSGERVLPGGP